MYMYTLNQATNKGSYLGQIFCHGKFSGRVQTFTAAEMTNYEISFYPVEHYYNYTQVHYMYKRHRHAVYGENGDYAPSCITAS